MNVFQSDVLPEVEEYFRILLRAPNQAQNIGPHLVPKFFEGLNVALLKQA